MNGELFSSTFDLIIYFCVVEIWGLYRFGSFWGGVWTCCEGGHVASYHCCLFSVVYLKHTHTARSVSDYHPTPPSNRNSQCILWWWWCWLWWPLLLVHPFLFLFPFLFKGLFGPERERESRVDFSVTFLIFGCRFMFKRSHFLSLSYQKKHTQTHTQSGVRERGWWGGQCRFLSFGDAEFNTFFFFLLKHDDTLSFYYFLQFLIHQIFFFKSRSLY